MNFTRPSFISCYFLILFYYVLLRVGLGEERQPTVYKGHLGSDLIRTSPILHTNSHGLYHPMQPDEFSKGNSSGAAYFSTSRQSSAKNFKSWLRKGFLIEEMKVNTTYLPDRRLNVFGVDDRLLAEPSLMDKYPFRCVGKFIRQQSFCTGVILAKALILTNRHCLGILSSGDLPTDFYETSRFLSGFSNGESNYEVRFTRVVWSSEKDDFALLELEEDIGDYTGWPAISWTTLDYFTTQRSLSMVGYSGDLLNAYDMPSYVSRCSSTGVVNGNALHDCDNTRGSSGSPMLDSLFGDSPTLLAYNDGEFRRGDKSEYLETYDEQFANTLKPCINFKSVYDTLTGNTDSSSSTTQPGGLNAGESFLLFAFLPACIIAVVYFMVRKRRKNESEQTLDLRI